MREFMDFLDCMEFDKARLLICQSLAGSIVDSEPVELAAALGRITSEEIRATEDLPPFARSTVDGFAVRSQDTFGASESSAALFSVVGEVFMGQGTNMELHPGQAALIPTGGMLPFGADAAVMLEYTEQPDGQTLLVQKTVAPNENVIIRGEDAAAGSVLVGRGVRITPQHIGLLAACGCHRLTVRNKIKVALISSGDELVDISETPAVGQIRDVNSYSLAAMLSELGCEVERIGIVKDSYEHFLASLSDAVTYFQMVVISGGSSVGAKDFTIPAMQDLGEPGILIHGLAIKPGKPTIFGMIGTVPVFGLPGHPVAALTVCGQVVAAAVHHMTGRQPAGSPKGIPAVLTRNIASAPGRDDFVNVRLMKRNGGYAAEPILGKSGLISIMAQADGILHIPAWKSGLYEGEHVFIYPCLNDSASLDGE